ncbi:MAG: amidohydrolase family protein, partial [Solirubrobacteraceae bacterium]
MSFDVVIRGAVVVGGGSPGRLDVGVADGLIASIGPELAGPASEEIDAGGLYLLPGVIDGHVHMNEPGRADWEGFETGTRALAAGGATTAIDMPLNAHPPTVTGAAFDEKRRCLERSALVDVALWGGLVPGGVEAMDELAARGVVGFKAFMCSSGIDDFPGVDDLTLYEGMCRAAGLGLPVAVHAESEVITAGLAQRAHAEGRTAMRDFIASRP